MNLIDTYIRHEIASLGFEFVPRLPARTIRDWGLEFTIEFLFHPDRMWRLDYAIPSRKIGIEIQGATYTAGKHTRGTGYANDCEKLNAAQCLGWRVLWYTTQQLRADPSVVARDIKLLLDK